MLSAQQFFESHSLLKAAVVNAVRPKHIRGEHGQELVVRLKRHDPRTSTPMFVPGRTQAFADPADRIGLLVLDAHDGIPPEPVFGKT